MCSGPRLPSEGKPWSFLTSYQWVAQQAGIRDSVCSKSTLKKVHHYSLPFPLARKKISKKKRKLICGRSGVHFFLRFPFFSFFVREILGWKEGFVRNNWRSSSSPTFFCVWSEENWPRRTHFNFPHPYFFSGRPKYVCFWKHYFGGGFEGVGRRRNFFFYLQSRIFAFKNSRISAREFPPPNIHKIPGHAITGRAYIRCVYT